MIPQSSIAVGSFVSFDLYAPATLSTGYSNVQVVGVVDWRTAQQFNPIATIHASVFPSLPTGTPNDFQAYPYMLLEMPDNSIISIGLPWIVDASYVVNNTQTMTIVMTSISPEDQERVKVGLAALGFSNYTITLSTPA